MNYRCDFDVEAPSRYPTHPSGAGDSLVAVTAHQSAAVGLTSLGELKRVVQIDLAESVRRSEGSHEDGDL